MELARRLAAEQGKTSSSPFTISTWPSATPDGLVFLKDGRVVADGRPDDILSEDLLRRVYDIPMQIIDHGGRRFIVK